MFEQLTDAQLNAAYFAFDEVSDKIHHYPGDFTEEEMEAYDDLWNAAFAECRRRKLW